MLVIEDTRINQLTVANMLNELGYQAEVVGSGSAGLAALARDEHASAVLQALLDGEAGAACAS